ncbi:hypothetical protein PIB30_089684, partial [Stylosanthes scabra]|nr:hypothetical protein [Stylosanthes scabra]
MECAIWLLVMEISPQALDRSFHDGEFTLSSGSRRFSLRLCFLGIAKRNGALQRPGARGRHGSGQSRATPSSTSATSRMKGKNPSRWQRRLIPEPVRLAEAARDGGSSTMQ